MPTTRKWHLVTYDIRDPKRLRRAARILTGFGTRIQYSVFTCQLTDRDRERLRWELSKVLTNEDSLLIFSICEKCIQALRKLDTQGCWPPDLPRYTII